MRQILVPNLILLVVPDAMARLMNGSAMSLMADGMLPSGVPPYFDVVCTGMIGCSAIQRDWNPKSSAFLANAPTSPVLLFTATFTPTFIRSPLVVLPGGDSTEYLGKKCPDVTTPHAVCSRGEF